MSVIPNTPVVPVGFSAPCHRGVENRLAESINAKATVNKKLVSAPQRLHMGMRAGAGISLPLVIIL